MTDTVSPDAPEEAETTEDSASLLVREAYIAGDHGAIDLVFENGRAMVAIVGSDLQPLIGQNGATLDALQELTRLAVQQQTGVRSRLMLDVSGHRKGRREELTALATDTAAKVLDSGEAVRLT